MKISPREYIYALSVSWSPYDNTFKVRGRYRLSHKVDIENINKVIITKNDDFYVRIRGHSYSKAWDDAKKLFRPLFVKSNVVNSDKGWDYIDEAVPWDLSMCYNVMREHFPYTGETWETRFIRENPMWNGDWAYGRYHYVNLWLTEGIYE